MLVGLPCPISEYLDSSPSFAPDSSFLPVQILGGSGNASNNLALAFHFGSGIELLAPSLSMALPQPSHALEVWLSRWELSLCLCKCASQEINKTILPIITVPISLKPPKAYKIITKLH